MSIYAVAWPQEQSLHRGFYVFTGMALRKSPFLPLHKSFPMTYFGANFVCSMAISNITLKIIVGTRGGADDTEVAERMCYLLRLSCLPGLS